jgi:hypothetical protein
MKRAQAWIFEYIISFLIFLGALFVAISVLSGSSDASNYVSLKGEANHISGLLLSEGLPKEWGYDNVQAIGVLSGDRVDAYKVEEFQKLSYSSMKSLLGVTNEFVFYFENVSGIIDINGRCYWGYDYSTCDDFLDNITYSELSFVRRITVFNSSLVEMVVLSWR